VTRKFQLEKSDDLDAVYKLFGVCAHHCSNIEYSLAFLLHPAKWNKHSVHLDRKKKELQDKFKNIGNWTDAMRRFDEALDHVELDIDALNKRPLGDLINQASNNYPLTNEQKTYLKGILKKRNHVIHNIWGIYGKRLKDPVIAKKMLNELRDYEKYFGLASDWLHEQACLLNGVMEEGEISENRKSKNRP
jgi:hypothetical protein